MSSESDRLATDCDSRTAVIGQVLACGGAIPVAEVGDGCLGLADNRPLDSFQLSETRFRLAEDRR